MQVNFKSPKFKRLQSHWYKKLKDSGFEDIENVNSPGESLHQWHSFYFFNYSKASFDIRWSYYQRATELLYDYVFENITERKIWAAHANGDSIRKIAAEFEMPFNEVRLTISKIKKALK